MKRSRIHRSRTPHPWRHPLATAIILLLPAMLARPAAAQHRYDEWHFGYGMSIRFTPSGVTVPNGSAIPALEGCASICDPATGQLLFYTDGISVWNRRNQKMFNGNGVLLGNTSSVQAALIVPMPADPDRYYIFTNDATEAPAPPNGYHYAIVDMRLDGGLGDVAVAGEELLADVSEHQTAVRHCNGRDFWVICHANLGSRFNAFLVTPEGVAKAPVVSELGQSIDGYGNSGGRTPQGEIKASPDGSRLAATFGNGVCELYAFDRKSGRLSSPIRLQERAINGFYHISASFSPDGTKLYVSSNSGLVQYALESGDPATIIASRWTVSGTEGSGLQLGPDGRIYRMSMSKPNHLSVIRRPNLPRALCDHDEQGIGLGSWSYSFGLPNNIDAIDGPPPVLASIPRDLVAEPGERIEAPITIEAPAGMAPTRTVSLTLRYDSTMLRLITDDPLVGTTTVGTLLDGWSIGSVIDRPGYFAATWSAPPGATGLAGGGTLLRLRFTTFLSAIPGTRPALASELPFSLTIDTACAEAEAAAGRARLEMCGIGMRLMEMSAARYALREIAPNPASASVTIGFSIGLDAPTRVEIFDNAGSPVDLLLDRRLASGEYLLTWDGSRLPTGRYFCRISSGSWRETRGILLLR